MSTYIEHFKFRGNFKMKIRPETLCLQDEQKSHDIVF